MITEMRRTPKTDGVPSFLYHPTFDAPTAPKQYAPLKDYDSSAYDIRYMPDEVTRDLTKRMHYAAFRLSKAGAAAERNRWQSHYFQLRDLVVLGNRKLVYRAVRRRMALSNHTDDLIGDCQIVLIQAVAAFNPWLGIRFSTYAYTCLLRALSRLSQRQSTDWLSRSLSLDTLPDGEPGGPFEDEHSNGFPRLEEFLRDDHPLLSHREKLIIARRFYLSDAASNQTLEKVGRDLGLSKERVRQVQASALDKLRKALLDEPVDA